MRLPPALRALALCSALLAAAGAEAEPESPAAAEPEAPATPQEPAATAEPAPDPRELLRRAEDALRGRGSIVDATMTILSRKRPRSRELRIRIFDDRRADRALVRVLSPEEHAGTALLKLPPNLWLYSPEPRETTRIPGSGWSERFLGSDFTRDDLVRGSAGAAGGEPRLLALDEHAGEGGDRRAWVVETRLPADARSGLGRIVAWIDVEHMTPLRVDFHAPDGSLLRTLRLEELREIAGRRYPHRWVMRWSGEKGRETRIEVDAIRFDPSFEAGLFTTRRLAPADP